LATAFAGVALTTSIPPVWAIAVNAVMLVRHLTDTGPVYALHSALRPGSHLDGVRPWLVPGCALAAAAAAAIAVGILMRGAGQAEPPGTTQAT
jgi:predicted membrane protein